MGLNPSDQLAGGLKGFPTLGDPPFQEACKVLAIAELRNAGFPRGSETLISFECQVYKRGSEAANLAKAGISFPGMAEESDREWVWSYDVKAELYGWQFRRAWYYWSAHAVNRDYYIPVDVAEKFNQEFRHVVRVEGHGGGQDVRRPVEGYHVDTPQGLGALIELLKKRDSHDRH